MADFEKIMASARLPETGVPLCLAGHLQRRHEQLEAELVEAQDADRRDDSLAGGGRARKVAEQIQALEAEMREETHTFVLRALPRGQFRDLVEAHPPRDGDRNDQSLGANSVTLPVALIAKCCIDPVMTEEQVDQLLEVLSEGQMLELHGAALALNRIPVDVPKSVAASAILARTGPPLRPPAPGAFLGDGSTAGSLAG